MLAKVIKEFQSFNFYQYNLKIDLKNTFKVLEHSQHIWISIHTKIPFLKPTIFKRIKKKEMFMHLPFFF